MQSELVRDVLAQMDMAFAGIGELDVKADRPGIALLTTEGDAGTQGLDHDDFAQELIALRPGTQSRSGATSSNDLHTDAGSFITASSGHDAGPSGTLPEARDTQPEPENKRAFVPDAEAARPPSTQTDLEVLAGDEAFPEDVSTNPTHDAPPVHPIPNMQQEFEESILDSIEPTALQSSFNLRVSNARTRRQKLLDLDDVDEDAAYSARWRQKPGAKFHPLRKLIAQIAYGIHLLHTGNAISDREVVKILQKHVDEIDSFVEDTLEDFDLAIHDINDRIDHLRLPLEHSRTFNRMLCDRNFRDSIIAGNDIIERVIARTTKSMNRALEDVRHGWESTRSLNTYLASITLSWSHTDVERMNVLLAMDGNTDGWIACFQKIESRAETLLAGMMKLGYIVDEVAKRCGIASRRKTVRSSMDSCENANNQPSAVAARRSNMIPPPSRQVSITHPHSRHSRDKPLPVPPNRISTNSMSMTAQSIPGKQHAPHRPSLSSSPSLQSLDCLHRPSRPAGAESHRPSASASSFSPSPVQIQHFSPSPLAITSNATTGEMPLGAQTPDLANSSDSASTPNTPHVSGWSPSYSYASRSHPSSPGIQGPGEHHQTSIKSSIHLQDFILEEREEELNGLSRSSSPNTFMSVKSEMTSVEHNAISRPSTAASTIRLKPRSTTTRFSVFPTTSETRPVKQSTESMPRKDSAASVGARGELGNTGTFEYLQQDNGDDVDISTTKTGNTVFSPVFGPHVNQRSISEPILSKDETDVLGESLQKVLTVDSTIEQQSRDLIDSKQLTNGPSTNGPPTIAGIHQKQNSRAKVSFDALRSHPVDSDLYRRLSKARYGGYPQLAPNASMTSLPSFKSSSSRTDPLSTTARPVLVKKSSLSSMKQFFSKKSPSKEFAGYSRGTAMT